MVAAPGKAAHAGSRHCVQNRWAEAAFGDSGGGTHRKANQRPPTHRKLVRRLASWQPCGRGDVPRLAHTRSKPSCSSGSQATVYQIARAFGSARAVRDLCWVTRWGASNLNRGGPGSRWRGTLCGGTSNLSRSEERRPPGLHAGWAVPRGRPRRGVGGPPVAPAAAGGGTGAALLRWGGVALGPPPEAFSRLLLLLLRGKFQPAQALLLLDQFNAHQIWYIRKFARQASRGPKAGGVRCAAKGRLRPAAARAVFARIARARVCRPASQCFRGVSRSRGCAAAWGSQPAM